MTTKQKIKIITELSVDKDGSGSNKVIKKIKKTFRNKYDSDVNAKIFYGEKDSLNLGCGFVIPKKTPPEPSTEKIPVAVITDNNIIVEEDGQTVVLDGSQSYVKNNDTTNPSTLVYSWKQKKGSPTLGFTKEELASPVLQFPFKVEYENMQFELTVTLEQNGKKDNEVVNVIDNIDTNPPEPTDEFDEFGIALHNQLLDKDAGYKIQQRITDPNEFVYKLNKTDSHRFQFENLHFVDQNMGGYITLPSDLPADEEVSFLAKGGHSNDTNPEDSRSYHVGVRVDGSGVRTRLEFSQGDYSNSFAVVNTNLGDLRGKTVGFDFYALNKTDLTGKNVAVQLIVLVDTKGLDSNGKPLNEWQKIYDVTDDGSWDSQGRSPFFDSSRGDADHIIGIRIDSTTTKPDIYGLHASQMQELVQVPPNPDGQLDEFGTRIPFKLTGRYVDLEMGSDHRNGQRFSVNHFFTNYIGIGYLLTGQGQELIENKHDGPNHSGRTDVNNTAHTWTEPAFHINDGQARIGSEHPHPDNGPEIIPEGAIKIGNLDKKWVGYGSYGYTSKDGYRAIGLLGTNDPFDANGKPKNNWQLGFHLIDKGQVCNAQGNNKGCEIRQIPPPGNPDGAEYEIRMHHATNHDTKFKWFRVYEIENPRTDDPPKLS